MPANDKRTVRLSNSEMPKDVKNALLMMYSSQILEVIDNRDDFPRGDLQGVVEAIVLNLLNGNHQSMYEKISKMGEWTMKKWKQKAPAQFKKRVPVFL